MKKGFGQLMAGMKELGTKAQAKAQQVGNFLAWGGSCVGCAHCMNFASVCSFCRP
jgi:hypothetical protein